MKKLLAIVAVGTCALVSSAFAQDESNAIGITARIGYQFGATFTKANGHSGSITGPVIGADFTFSHHRGLALSFTPAIVMGGALGKGSTDGRIYRFTLSAQQSLKHDNYFRLEAGFANTEARGGDFQDVNDFVAGAAVGFMLPKSPGLIRHLTPALEIGGFASRHRQLSGAQVTLSLKF